MRSPTKAQAILNEARQRVEQAREAVDIAESQLGIANATLTAYERSYNELEKSLARAPRKVTKKPAKDVDADGAALRAREIISVKDICGICGNIKGHPDHDTEHYLGAHEFEPGKSSASSVGKKSARKTQAKQSEVNSETEKDAVTNAASVASGGD